METSPGDEGLATRSAEAIQEAGLKLGLHWIPLKPWPDVVRMLFSWPGTDVRCAEVYCHPKATHCFLYERDKDGYNQQGRSVPIRPTTLDHDVRIVWRFLKWGRR